MLQKEENMKGSLIHKWYLDNANELYRYFGKILLDDSGLLWLSIQSFPLPHTFQQRNSVLLIKTPGVNIENHTGYDFFMDLNLKRLDDQQEKHLIDRESYNPFLSLGCTKPQ
jgi:hypothetical protein